MAKKCRHRKGVITAIAHYVDFTPDQEPFTAGVIESCGLETITAEAIVICWCPKCRVAKYIDVDNNDWSTSED